MELKDVNILKKVSLDEKFLAKLRADEDLEPVDRYRINHLSRPKYFHTVLETVTKYCDFKLAQELCREPIWIIEVEWKKTK